LKKGIWNHKTKSYIWYHSTLNGLVDKISKEGLKIFSIPTFQTSSEDRIYVSTLPFTLEKDFSTFAVDLSELSWEDAGWPFGTSEEPLEKRWQLVVMKNINQKYLRLLSRQETENLIKTYKK